MDQIIAEADHTWTHEGMRIALYKPPRNKGYIRLPDGLVGAWTSANEVRRALELPYALAYGPHPDIIGYPENDRWLGLDAFGLQAHPRHKAYDAYVSEKIHAQLLDLAARLITAAEFAKQGFSVKPAELTLTHEDVLAMAQATGHESKRAVVPLKLGETAWYPGMGYHSFRGQCTAIYEFDRDTVKAHCEL